jgi:hypothetical protein
MAAIEVNPVHKFAETPSRPIMSTHQNTSSNNENLLTEINELKQNQNIMRNDLMALMSICNKIGESVVDVKEKLSQYDIDGDGDDAPSSDQFDNGEVTESADEGESQNRDDAADDDE